MTKLVCRLLDAQDQLLGWVEHGAHLRGDGHVRADGRVTIPVDRDGYASQVSVHWCDVNVEVRSPIPLPVVVRPGDTLTVFEYATSMIKVGDMPGPLPAVTVRQAVAVAVPVGQLGARS